MAKPVAGSGQTLTEEKAADTPAEAPSPRPRSRPRPSPEAPESEASPVGNESHDEETVAAAPSRRRMILLGVLALAAVALLVTGSILAAAVLERANENSARADAVAAARQEVVNLLTINPKTLDADIQRVLDGATGEFKRDFAGQRQLFVDMVTTDKVRTTGEIKSIGTESFTGSKATVLVAAHSTVKNAKVPKGEARDYRFRVSLEHVDDRWLVAKMEFVP